MRSRCAGFLVVAVAAVFLSAPVPPAWALLAEEPVLATKLDELVPGGDWSADGTASYLTYSRNSAAEPKAYDAYLRTTRNGTTRVIRLNAKGTGWGGGIDAPLVVYQQVVNGESNVKVFDLATRVRSNPPAGVNTRQWEWHPTVSDPWLLFGRRKFSAPKADAVILANRLTGETRTLASSTHIGLAAGQVNGNWAVFHRCITLCNVFLYDIDNGTTVRLARPDADGDDPEHQFSPSVTSDGTVYFVRGIDDCDSPLSLVRIPLGDPTTGTVIGTIPHGRYVLTTFTRANPDGSIDVLFDQISCRSGKGDLYKFIDS